MARKSVGKFSTKFTDYYSNSFVGVLELSLAIVRTNFKGLNGFISLVCYCK